MTENLRYALSVTAFLAAIKRSRHPLPERIGFGDLLGVATHRISRLIAKDRGAWQDDAHTSATIASQAITKYASEIKETANGRGRRPRRQAGEIKKSSLKGASKQMAKSMSKKQLKEFASTKRKNLPRKKSSK